MSAPPLSLKRSTPRTAWRQLPRGSRDTLFLLGVITWILVPHVTHLPLWCSGLTALVLLWRVRLAWIQAPLPPRWVLLVALCVSLAGLILSYRSLGGRDAGITLLVALTALKTLELRASRDALVIFFLGFFLILTQFVHTQSLPVAAMMVIGVWGLLTALVLAHMPVGQPALRHAAKLAAHTALLGTPIMVTLFVLFPRIGPLWGQAQEGLGRTGLSEQLQLGDIAQLAQDDAIVLRLQLPNGHDINPKSLYFRGPVLGDFDGQQWTAHPHDVQTEPLQIRTLGLPIAYELTLEAQGHMVLPLLESTPSIPQVSGYTSPLQLSPRGDMRWLANRPITERLHLRAQSWTQFTHGPVEFQDSLKRYLHLPPEANPKTRAWVKAIQKDPHHAHGDASAWALALMQHIRASHYRYTLSPGNYGTHAIDEFWLDRQAGFCEHYAASLVFILRSLGIPARIVTGYQGAELNPLDGTWVVRQRFAHAWVEYWQVGIGWLRADPTNAVAPERIEQAQTLMPDPGLVARTLEQVHPQLWPQLRSVWDASNHRWNQWVIQYTQGTQIQLLKSLGFPHGDATLLLRLLGLIAVVLGGGTVLWIWARHHRQDPWLKAWHRIVHTAHQQQGWHVPTGSATPLALAHWLRVKIGPSSDSLCEALRVLCMQRYGPAVTEVARPTGPKPDTLARFVCQQLRVLRPQPTHGPSYRAASKHETPQ